MYEKKAHFVEHQIIFRAASFIDRDSRAAGLLKELLVRNSTSRSRLN